MLATLDLDSMILAYQVTLFLFCLGLFINTVEFIRIANEFDQHGVFDWRVHRLEWRSVFRRGLLGTLLNKVYSKNGTVALLVGRAIALIVLVFLPLQSSAFSLTLLLVMLVSLVFSARHGYGGDGSDQMLNLVGLTLLLCVGAHSTPTTLLLGLSFLTLQACLAYAAAGFAKLASPQWRSGTPVYRIFNTGSYGAPAVGRFLESRTSLTYFLSWSVIVIECLFPAALFLPEPVLLAFLLWGVAFHALNAMIMGLNTFVPAFLATYPAVLFIASLIRGSLYPNL